MNFSNNYNYLLSLISKISMSFLLISTIGCSDKTPQEAVEASNQEKAESSQQGDSEDKEVDSTSLIIQAIVDHPDFLANFTKDQAPIKISGKKLKSISVKMFEKPVELVKGKKDKDSKAAMIWIKKIKEKKKKAYVWLMLKPSGVKGKFTLLKDDNGKWTVKKASLKKSKRSKRSKRSKKKK